MKKPLPLLLCLLLLTACGPEPSVPTPPPPTPSPAATPMPEETPSRWWDMLATDALPRPEDMDVALPDGILVRCLGQLAEPDVALYMVTYPTLNFPQFYLRQENTVEELGAILLFQNPPETLLSWGDFDGDGDEELVFTLRDGQRSALGVCTWDDGWTYHPFDSYGADLESVLEFQVQGRTATLTYGRETATYALGPEERLPIRLYVNFSDFCFFNVSGTDLSAIFGVGAEVDGQVRYFATVSAQVAYDGGDFTLRDLKLLSIGGV